eukprot:c8058_g1_i1.p2 GENE.c8058_g1_i1~~c8058_g1_i1.p2  ORF type:complete len:103 (-),score=5.78 c8058_g1_i1:55-363(-)
MRYSGFSSPHNGRNEKQIVDSVCCLESNRLQAGLPSTKNVVFASSKTNEILTIGNLFHLTLCMQSVHLFIGFGICLSEGRFEEDLVEGKYGYSSTIIETYPI